MTDIQIASMVASLRFTTWVLCVVVIVVAGNYVARTTGWRFWTDPSAARSALGIPLFVGLAIHQFGFWVWQLATIAGNHDVARTISASAVFTFSAYALIIAGIAGILSGFLLQLFGSLWGGVTVAIVAGLITLGTTIAWTLAP